MEIRPIDRVGLNLSWADRPNWQISNHMLKEALGCVPTLHWPDQGVPARMLGNVKVWVTPKEPTEMQPDFRPATNSWGKVRKGWKSRALCECPTCGKIVNAGRLHQHLKVHK